MARADAVLVPALAVDRAGNRLGRGGGGCDRALARVGPLMPLIALVYDGELLDHVPAEPHDVPVRAAVSPANSDNRRQGGITTWLGCRNSMLAWNPRAASRLDILSSLMPRVLI